MKISALFISLLLIVAVIISCGKEQPTSPQATTPEVTTSFGQGTGDPAVLAKLHAINDQLEAQGLDIRVEAIEFFTIGGGRPSARIHQQPFRWVPNDGRRAAQGEDITYLIDDENETTASGLSAAQTRNAINTAMDTWNNDKALKKVDLVKRPTAGGIDHTIFDSFFGFGGYGEWWHADIVNAGWWPRAYFEAVGGPGGGRGILAFSVTFTFTGTDANGDNYSDTALNEVYYNDTFGDPGDDRAGNPWGIDIALPGIDVETVGLHENGHSLELGHFGPPPDAVMNPVYAGPRHTPFPIDQAGMNAVWSSWPNP